MGIHFFLIYQNAMIKYFKIKGSRFAKVEINIIIFYCSMLKISLTFKENTQ